MNSSIAFDYEKDAGIHANSMKVASYTGDSNNELGIVLCDLINRAMKDPDALLYVLGQHWGPISKLDCNFGFTPAQGIHNIHRNHWDNTSSDAFRHESGENQDGALFVYFPKKKKWTGVFCAFRSLDCD